MARPKSLITGKDMKIAWSANWDDDLGGAPRARRTATSMLEKHRRQGEVRVRADLHVLPAADLRALPQPVLRGVLPVRGDLQARRGRHRPGRPGPLPRLADVRHRLPVQEDLLQPPHRQGREVHVLLSRGSRSGCRRCARRPASAGCATSGWSSTTPTGCSRPRRPRTSTTSTRRSATVFLDPNDPEVDARGRAGRASRGDWIDAAQRSPVYALINRYQVALPLHPEYRTMPMVWYIPPLSPVVDVVARHRPRRRGPGNLFGAIDALRIPVEYLAELFTAGDAAPVDAVLRKLAAMRSYMRDINLGREPDDVDPGGGRDDRGATSTTCTGCWRSPSTTSATSSRRRTPSRRTRWRSSPPSARSTTRAARAWAAPGRSARAPAAPTPVAVENFQMLQEPPDRATPSPTPADAAAGSTCSTGTARAPRRACSRPKGGDHEPPRTRRERQRTPAPRPGDRAAAGVAGAPRCCWTTPTRRCSAAARPAARRPSHGLPAPRRRAAAPRSSTTSGRTAAGRAAAPTTSRPSTTRDAAAST